MNICVTGGAGFIGSHVVDQFVAAGHHVTVLDNLSTGRKEFVHPQATFRHVDLVRDDLSTIFASSRFEVVIHAAAHKSVPKSIADPLFDAEQNVMATLRVLNACKEFGVRRLVFLSSGGAMYAEHPDRIPTPETEPVLPGSPYGISKLAGEHYVRFFSNTVPGFSGITLRLANVYGPRQDAGGEGGVVAIFVGKLQAQQPLTIYGDGTQTRDFVDVGDVANSVMMAVESDVIGEFNISSGLETSILTLAETCLRSRGSSVSIIHGEPRLGDYARSCLDSTRFQQAFGWKPSMSLEQGIQQMLA